MKRFVLRTRGVLIRVEDYIEKMFSSGEIIEIEVRKHDAKSREQEEKYHAMIWDIAKQMNYHGEKLDRESWKRLLVEAFAHVASETAKAENKPDPFADQARLLMSLDGKRVVQLGVQTRKFGKEVASEFIEYLYAFGTENGVKFTAKDMR